ncbi:NADPH-dependent FMN reductase [Frankia sp. Cj5]|uniref:NADPH-dependent FMN reductase n=1 Tax=Frankia sp. Cj5 TaxID=2880978 RepID=UPI001EF49DCF|nr:NAD(P)H-dependent oxidoreductase [Frankia sp. Cj5]
MPPTFPFPRIVVLSGNPRPASRTRTVARTVAERIARECAAGRGGHAAVPRPAAAGVENIDLALIAQYLFADTNGLVAAALASIRAADVLVVATPVYKGSYTGLLKAFLDLLPAGGLTGVIAVPVIVAGAPAHQAVAELHLRPLLAELGATVPTPAFSIVEAQLPALDTQVDDWAAANGRLVQAAAALVTEARVSEAAVSEAEFAR